MSLTGSAVLLDLYALCIGLLIFSSTVVALLTISTR